jgi:hypothetical protein
MRCVLSPFSVIGITQDICRQYKLIPESGSAVLKNGVLEISMPKAKTEKKVAVMAKAA